MTAYRFVTLTCDRCGEIFDEGIQTRVRECREAAAVRGWRYERRRDLCPICKNAGGGWPIRHEDREQVSA